MCHLPDIEVGCKRTCENAKHSGSDHPHSILAQLIPPPPPLAAGVINGSIKCIPEIPCDYSDLNKLGADWMAGRDKIIIIIIFIGVEK